MTVCFDWIPITEAMPCSGDYLVTRVRTIDRGDKTREIGYIDLLEYDGNEWVTILGTVVKNVKAWAKLPKAYEDEHGINYRELFARTVARRQCNDCRRAACEYKPLPGEHVRINCPLWEGEE